MNLFRLEIDDEIRVLRTNRASESVLIVNCLNWLYAMMLSPMSIIRPSMILTVHHFYDIVPFARAIEFNKKQDNCWGTGMVSVV